MHRMNQKGQDKATRWADDVDRGGHRGGNGKGKKRKKYCEVQVKQMTFQLTGWV